ncbi:MAG: 5'-methylthioadenosine/S-adenosylhomocysteine nucleosidase [Bryobacteraceae bacterium]
MLLRAWRSGGYQFEQHRYGHLDAWSFPELNLVLSAGGTGKAQFALQTQYLLDRVNACEGVICAGAAGALVDGISFGDVVVASATVEHDRRDRFFPKPPPSFPCAPEVLTRVGRSFEEFALNGVPRARFLDHATVARRTLCAPQESFRVHYGVIASGDEDIVDPERRREIREATGALAVAWEGAGGARACAFNTVAYAEVRGITDAADGCAPADFDACLEPAMSNVAVLLQKSSV